jgi:hypothetical protein
MQFDYASDFIFANMYMFMCKFQTLIMYIEKRNTLTNTFEFLRNNFLCLTRDDS